MNKIILASQSARRKQLLEWAEVEFEIVVKETDETFPGDLSPAEAAIHIAKKKIKAIKGIVDPRAIILAADTIVVLNGEIIGKPSGREEAIKILEKLSGQEHTVITGVAIEKEGQVVEFSDATDVLFHELSREQIEFYVDKYKPYDKAGAYAIQEWIGVVGIRSVTGDFYNVMGLPVSRVLMELRKFG